MARTPPPEGLTGLEQLQVYFPTSKPPTDEWMGSVLGFDHVEVEEGRVVLGATPDERYYNLVGTVVHGGFAASLMESATGYAVHSRLRANQAYSTVEMKVAFLKGITAQTGPVRAEARVVQLGRRVAFAEARLSDLSGRLLATASTTCVILEK